MYRRRTIKLSYLCLYIIVSLVGFIVVANTFPGPITDFVSLLGWCLISGSGIAVFALRITKSVSPMKFWALLCAVGCWLGLWYLCVAVMVNDGVMG